VPRCPAADLFGIKGRRWLDEQRLPADERQAVWALMRQLDFHGQELKLIHADLARVALGCENTKRLMTIPGVDVTVAMSITAAVGDFSRFSSPNKLVRHLGLNPRVKQSGGQPASHSRITKHGRAHARGMLLEAASGGVVASWLPEAGYDVKASTYDDMPNPIIVMEQPAVWEMLDRIAPGRAVDATGRHAGRLLDREHPVIAVDAATLILDQTRAKLTAADVHVSDLTSSTARGQQRRSRRLRARPDHLTELHAPIGGLVRVVRPGGRIVLSDVHPQFVSLGGQAYAADERRFVRNRSFPLPMSAPELIARSAIELGHETRNCRQGRGRQDDDLRDPGAAACAAGLPGACARQRSEPEPAADGWNSC
jgi:hypothetical protein